MTGSQRRMKAITAAVRVLLLPLLALAAPQGQAVAVKGDLQGYSHHSLTADDPCSSPAFVPSDVSQETLEAQRNFCTTLKVRRKRQTVQFGQESLRDIASSATALGSILGTPGSNDSNVPLIFPDTKWCGEGTIAANYNDLGKEQFADMCCRAHDHCPQSLDSFAYNSAYDLKNPIGYTLSSCDCDTEFRRCLDTNANSGLDWVSGLIKDIFENVLRTPCMKYMHPLKCVGSTSSDFSSADCNTYHFDKSRTARWFVLEHPPDKDGPVYRDASGRSLKPAEPTFAELNSRADSPTRSYLFGMVEKATAEASKEEKLGKLRALRAQHTLRQQTQG